MKNLLLLAAFGILLSPSARAEEPGPVALSTIAITGPTLAASDASGSFDNVKAQRDEHDAMKAKVEETEEK